MSKASIDVRNGAEVAVDKLVELAVEVVGELRRIEVLRFTRSIKELPPLQLVGLAHRLEEATQFVQQHTKHGEFMPKAWGQALFQLLEEKYKVFLTNDDMHNILVLAMEKTLQQPATMTLSSGLTCEVSVTKVVRTGLPGRPSRKCVPCGKPAMYKWISRSRPTADPVIVCPQCGENLAGNYRDELVPL